VIKQLYGNLIGESSTGVECPEPFEGGLTGGGGEFGFELFDGRFVFAVSKKSDGGLSMLLGRIVEEFDEVGG
jgi:hypothetical protein